ncbi:MAG: glycosyltransferase family 2 protein [Anaerolineae bacterium]|nr:glycosyltransferase family 2 protein [Anaerolineae bacterium]
MATENSTRPFLSLVVPAYNEEQRLPTGLQTIVEFVERQPFSVEVVVVDNNSSDRTGAIIQEFAEKYPCVRGLFEKAQGKGAAVRTGMLAAQGEYRFFADADLSMPIDEVEKFLPPHINDYDILIASREVSGAVRYDEPWHRHLMGRVFNTIVRWFAVPRLQDTQCGFKMFNAKATEDLFPLQTMNGWSFDVEILYAAQRRGYRIAEVPVNWYYKANTRINPIRDSINMFVEVFRIRRNGRRGLYDR